MGNLPTSRTLTLVPGDPIPSALLNEVQDNIIGHKRPVFKRTFLPKFVIPGTNPYAGSLFGSGQLGWSSAAGAVNTSFDIPFEDGDRLINLRYWAAGDGTVDLTTGKIFWAPAMTGAVSTIANWTDNNRSSTFAIVDVAAISTGPAFTNTTLTADGNLFVQLITNAANYQLGSFTAWFDRL